MLAIEMAPPEDLLNFWLSEAVGEAKKAEMLGDVPVGAVMVCNNEIIARGHNRRELIQDPIQHAEIIAIQEAARRLGSWRLIDCDLIVTLEPCVMCTGALVSARVRQVYFGAPDPKAGGCGSVYSLNQSEKLNHRFEAMSLNDGTCSQLLTDFFKKRRAINP